MRPRRESALGSRAAVALFCAARAASADPSPRVALEPLETPIAGDHFFLAPDAGVPRGSGFAAKLFESFAYRPLLTLPKLDGEHDIVASELYFDAGASYSLLGRAVFGVDLPFVPFEGGEATERAAVGDLRLTSRVRIAGTRQAELGTEARVYLPTGNPGALTSDGSLRAAELVTLSGASRPLVYSFSVGYLARKRRDVYGSDVGPALPFAAAVALDIADRLQIGPELQGFTVVGGGRTPFADHTTPVIGLLGARFRAGSLVIGAGCGPGLSHAPGVSPHVVFSLAWEPPPPKPPVETSVPPSPSPTSSSSEPASPPPAPPSPPPTPLSFSLPPLPPASPPSEPPDPRTVARALFQRGISAYDAGRYDDAVNDFQTAFAIKPHPAVLRNIGLAELMRGDAHTACTYFKRWRVEARPRPKDVEQIADSIRDACR